MNSPYEISKFDVMSYAKYYIDIQGGRRVDDPLGNRVEKIEYSFDHKKETIYFDDNSIF